MTPTTWIFVAFAAGLLLGAVYFASLWGTIRVLPSTRRPTGVLLLWFVVRSALVLAGVFVVWGGDLNRLVACLSGFLVARALSLAFFGKRRSEASARDSLQHHATKPRELRT